MVYRTTDPYKEQDLENRMMMYKERLHCTEDTKIHVHQRVIGVKGSEHQFSLLSIKDYVESV